MYGSTKKRVQVKTFGGCSFSREALETRMNAWLDGFAAADVIEITTSTVKSLDPNHYAVPYTDLCHYGTVVYKV